MIRLFGLCAALLMAVAAEAQGPSAPWRTVTTEHFRVHYPAAYEEWSLRAASRLESIRSAVVAEVGYDAGEVVDVIVADPIAQPNGLAYPLLDTPRIILYTHPPGPDEQIGAYSSWIDLLAVHEVAHIVHMLRPSRNPMQRLLERHVLRLNRITLSAPRWVLEGYATVIEGRLTGAGRPTSTLRALVLRQWAAHGRLPSYDGLDGDSRFLGMSMAYLAGSAFLEWLEQRSGPESLRNVWTRLTARQRRSFDGAFAGVFGESPERLYGQFTAELTASALAVNRAEPMRDGELWQETSRGSGDPDVSPDGSRIAVVLRDRDQPPRLVVWSTGPPEKEEKRYQEQLGKIRERDPADVMPVRSKPLTREPLHTFTPTDGRDLLTPRWMPDGASILYAQRQPDREGFLHHDLFLRHADSGVSRRITHLADVREADPLPDGRSAVALHSRHGYSQLVVVDLETGAVRPLTEKSLDVVYAHPRVDGAGRTVAYVMNRGGVWSLVLQDLATGTESVIAPDPGAAFAWPEWMPDGESIIATVFSRGFAELYRVSRDGSKTPITRTSGGGMQAAPAADGRIFFMSLQPDGFVVRVLPDANDAASVPPYDETLVPAVPPRPTAAVAFAPQDLPSSRPYAIGRQEVSFLTGQQYGPSQSATELGVRIGDVVGRLDTIVLASLADNDAQRGIGLASAWRGWPVELHAALFRTEDDEMKRDGAEVRGVWSRMRRRDRLVLEAGFLAGNPLDLGFVEARFGRFRVFTRGRIQQDVLVGFETGSFEQLRARYRVTARRRDARLTVEIEHRRLQGADRPEDRLRLGGLPSSIIPRAAFANRILDPAVPVAAVSGDDYQGVRAEATIPGVPFSLFYQHHGVDGTSVDVAGAEMTFGSDPMPIVGLPGLDATIGVARILSGPIERDTNWWLGLRWRP